MVLPALPVAVPLLVAALLTAASRLTPRRLVDSVSIATSGAVAGICAYLALASANASIVYAFGGWQPIRGVELGILFVIDPLSAGLASLCAAVFLAIFLYSWRYFREIKSLYHVLMLVFLASMMGFCLTGDLFNLFVFYELMSVTAFTITAYKVEYQGPIQGALNFGITNSIGAYVILLGIALVYGRTGALNLAQIGHALAGKPPDGLVIAAFILILSGFFVKAAIVPFHFWLPDAEAVAPAPICAIFSAVMDELGLYAVARVYWTVFAGTTGPYADHLRVVFVVGGVVTALLGALMCILQRNLKRLLAYSTLAHMGLFLLGFAFFTPLGLAGTALFILGHALVKAALFLMTGIIQHRFSTVDENKLRRRGRAIPYTGILFAIGGFALAATPPFLTYLGKGMIDSASGAVGYSWLADIQVLASIFTGGPVLRAAGSIFLGWGSDEAVQGDEQADSGEEPGEGASESGGSRSRTPVIMFAGALLLMIAALVMTFVPHLAQGTELYAARFEDQALYISTVFPRVANPAPLPPLEPPGPDPSMVVSGLISMGGALGYAVLALGWHRVPKQVQRAVELLTRPLVTGLRALQSGHAGDYVAWITLGLAVFGAGFIVALH